MVDGKQVECVPSDRHLEARARSAAGLARQCAALERHGVVMRDDIARSHAASGYDIGPPQLCVSPAALEADRSLALGSGQIMYSLQSITAYLTRPSAKP